MWISATGKAESSVTPMPINQSRQKESANGIWTAHSEVTSRLPMDRFCNNSNRTYCILVFAASFSRKSAFRPDRKTHRRRPWFIRTSTWYVWSVGVTNKSTPVHLVSNEVELAWCTGHLMVGCPHGQIPLRGCKQTPPQEDTYHIESGATNFIVRICALVILRMRICLFGQVDISWL